MSKQLNLRVSDDLYAMIQQLADGTRKHCPTCGKTWDLTGSVFTEPKSPSTFAKEVLEDVIQRLAIESEHKTRKDSN